MRLGAVHMGESVNALYRIVFPMMALEQLGHEVVRVEQRLRTPLAIEGLAGCDLVHIHRPVLLDDDGAAVARIQETGALVGFDEDDNIAAAPAELVERTGQDWLPRVKRNFEHLLSWAPRVDVLTTPSTYLAEQLESAGAANVHVVDNYLPGEFLRVQPQGHDGIVVGWHACDEHLLDAEMLGIAEVLGRLLEAHPHVHVVTIGVDLGLAHERYRRIENVSFDQLTRHLADFDIGIVPLVENPFNCGRSNVKAREYAAASVPWLASPVGNYRELGKAEGGRLVEDDEWYDALDGLVRSALQRAMLRRRGRGWAKQGTVWRTAGVWEQIFLDAIDDARAA